VQIRHACPHRRGGQGKGQQNAKQEADVAHRFARLRFDDCHGRSGRSNEGSSTGHGLLRNVERAQPRMVSAKRSWAATIFCRLSPQGLHLSQLPCSMRPARSNSAGTSVATDANRLSRTPWGLARTTKGASARC
jgi:hypothetical protein